MYKAIKSLTPWFAASALVVGLAFTSLVGGSGQVTGTKNTAETEISGFGIGIGFYGGGRPSRRGYYRGGGGYYRGGPVHYRYYGPSGYYAPYDPYYNQGYYYYR